MGCDNSKPEVEKANHLTTNGKDIARVREARDVFSFAGGSGRKRSISLGVLELLMHPPPCHYRLRLFAVILFLSNSCVGMIHLVGEPLKIDSLVNSPKLVLIVYRKSGIQKDSNTRTVKKSASIKGAERWRRREEGNKRPGTTDPSSRGGSKERQKQGPCGSSGSNHGL